MKIATYVVMGSIGVGLLVTACAASSEDVEVKPQSSIDTQAKAADGRLLNLSHIECAEGGGVDAHFVLLFAGSGNPGPISGTTNQGAFGPIDPDKHSGNVWHYDVPLGTSVDGGEIVILTAQVGTTPLHNPGDYGNFAHCGDRPPPPVCSVTVTPGPVCMHANDVFGVSGTQGIPDPQRECEWLGLELIGKDEGPFSGNTTKASMDAYVAIVKGGNGGGDVCEAGSGSIYDIYSPVTKGEILWTGNKTGVSHVTYCRCPDIAQ